jgi:predicted nucleic acid-binding protein
MLSRDLTIDACAVMNLVNGGEAEHWLARIHSRPHVTPVVEGECTGKTQTEKAFHALLEAELLERSDAQVSADALTSFITEHDLGAGESEAILSCIESGRHLWSDDKRARTVGTTILGEARVAGTLRVMKSLVQLEDLTADSAFQAYGRMRAAGGFLPNRAAAWFSDAD